LSSKLDPSTEVAQTEIDYSTKLLNRTEIAEDTFAFEFERPSGFHFKPGQFIDLTLQQGTGQGAGRLVHTFSIASSQFAPYISVATRMRDTPFKRALASLPLGTEIEMRGPMGSFLLHSNPARPAVLLAGGIGIAPFLSMISSAAIGSINRAISLFYANRSLENAAFMGNLLDLAASNKNLRFIPTFTRLKADHHGWAGAVGHIDTRLLAAHIGTAQNTIFYIAGPPAMVAAARQSVVDLGVNEDDIRSEEFLGY